ncbi:MAG: type II secretion system F family protein [Deltaproteobacteria bacterium]|nr:type II secretion system F family protein [Deltaproteobacteria bacterium]MBW2696650.1 type II secretion system F family protein [Deltaproteobacteria bacterium]
MMFLAICIGLMTLFLSLAFFANPGKTVAEKRLRRFATNEQNATAGAGEEVTLLDDEGSARAILGRLLSRFAVTGGSETSGESRVYGTVRQRLVEAGFRRPSALAVYMGSRVVLGAALALLVILGSWSMGRTPPILIIGITSAVGYVLPGVIVDRLRAKRQASIQRGLADSIDMMVVCVEAGLGLAATMSRVAKEFQDNEPIISGEFMVTVAETQAGRSLMDALRSMAKRTGNQDLNALVALLVQTERFGTPLVDTLRTQADSMRFERMQRAEESAQKAPVKMMLPAALIFLAVVLILAGPAAIKISSVLQGPG